MKSKSKALELFLALGLAASVAACGTTPDEGADTEAPETTEEIAPEEEVSDTEGGEGGEGGEG